MDETAEHFCTIPLMTNVADKDLGLLIRIYALRLQGIDEEEMQDLCDADMYPVDLYDEVTNLYLAFQSKEMAEE